MLILLTLDKISYEIFKIEYVLSLIWSKGVLI